MNRRVCKLACAPSGALEFFRIGAQQAAHPTPSASLAAPEFGEESEKSDAALKAFLEQQDVHALVAVLLELAEDHDAVRKRLARLQVAAKPARLAAFIEGDASFFEQADAVFRRLCRFGRVVGAVRREESATIQKALFEKRRLPSPICMDGWRGATCVYRALLDDVLVRAYAPAYPYAASYWVRLRTIAAHGAALAPLQSHADYAHQVEKQHARKPRFWACVAEVQERA